MGESSYLNQLLRPNVLIAPGTFYSVPTRSIFVSYHHGFDRYWYQEFARCFCETFEVFEDTSAERAKNSHDSDYIMWSLRDNHIKGSSCTIVLCGPQTAGRKFVDWEIAATLDKTHGLIGVCLPTCAVDRRRYLVPDRLYDNIESGYAIWIPWQALTQGGPDFLRAQIETAYNKSTSLIRNDRQKMVRCVTV